MECLHFHAHDDLRHFESLDTPIWVFDVDNHKMWWANRRALTFWRAEGLEVLLARDFSSDSEIVRERLREVVAPESGGVCVQESWTLYPAGQPVNALLAFQPAKLGETGQGILIEVRQIQSDFADADTWRMLEAARATSLMVSSFSLDGKLLTQNPASAACFAQPNAAAAERTNDASDLENRFVAPRVADELLRRVRADERFSWEAKVRTRAGQRTHLVSARRGRDPITGAFVAILAEEDITGIALNRHRQQQVHRQLEGAYAERTDKLREAEERFALAVEMASIWDWNLETDHLFMSPSFFRKLGYEEDRFGPEMRGKAIGPFLHKDDRPRFREANKRLLADPARPISEEVRCITKSGDVRWYHAQGRFICDQTGNPVRSVGLLTDITDRKELQASLLASQRLEAIGQLTGGVAHDFNNLLTVIQGNAQLLQETQEADPELTREIVRAVQRGAELTRRLLAFARRQTLSPKAVDLSDLMQAMHKSILRVLTENIEVETDLPDDLWPVYADVAQVEAALLNLSINARDAMPSGGHLRLSCANRHFATPAEMDGLELSPGQYVEISVSDCGTGMSAETRAKAFEPFFTTKGVGRGSGLGLSMVLGFSRQSGGDARIESAPGKGTAVRMYLPRATMEADPAAPTPPKRLALGTGEHIHILEDNPSVQSMLARVLTSLGYSVSTSTTVNAALQASEMRPLPQLYLVDVILPGGQSGVDFARAMRAVQPDAKIVLMSGYPDTELAHGKLDKLASAFMTKPIDKARLSEVIHAVLSTSRVGV